MNSIAACAILERFTIADVLSGEHEHELARLLPAKTFVSILRATLDLTADSRAGAPRDGDRAGATFVSL